MAFFASSSSPSSSRLPNIMTPLLSQNDKSKRNHTASLGSPVAGAQEIPDANSSAIEQDRGVTRIEALYQAFGAGVDRAPIWMLYVSIGLISFAYSLSSNTISNFLNFATSAFDSHSLLGTIEVAIYVLGAVAKPFIAKLSDITSRPVAYFISLIFYVLGFVVVACSSSVQAVAAGELLYTVGNTGISLVTDILVADISPLKWRGLATALPTSPFIINAFISGYIVDGLGEDGWRWGYGMFAIIMPVAMFPALMVLFWADIKVKRIGALSISASSYSGRTQKNERRSWFDLWKFWWIQIDAVGLIILGFAWALLLLPLTLYQHSDDRWRNPSLIGMFVTGGALLMLFILHEKYLAVHPMLPFRVLNRTFLCCVVIDVFYFISGNMRSTYYSSWVYVVKDWSLRNWTFFTNMLTVGLCIFGILAGIIQRATHRYKYLQVFGTLIRVVGMVLTLHARGPNATDGALVWTQILIAIGGAFSVAGSKVASQASVPHQDLATVIAQLALWTSIGGAIGSAIAAAVWNGKMPGNLMKQLSGKLSATEILKIYGSIKIARNQPPDIRAGVITAYNDTMWYLYMPALLLSLVPFIAALLTQNFFLGDSHNAIENKIVVSSGNEVGGDDAEAVAPAVTSTDERMEGYAAISSERRD